MGCHPWGCKELDTTERRSTAQQQAIDFSLCQKIIYLLICSSEYNPDCYSPMTFHIYFSSLTVGSKNRCWIHVRFWFNQLIPLVLKNQELMEFWNSELIPDGKDRSQRNEASLAPSHRKLQARSEPGLWLSGCGPVVFPLLCCTLLLHSHWLPKPLYLALTRCCI